MTKNKLALVKVSSVDDRLMPSGLACLQAYLKERKVSTKVHIFRSEDYLLPKVIKDPLIQLSPPNFIMNHQDLPLLLPLIDNALRSSKVSVNLPIFIDLFKDYAQRLFEEPEVTKGRYEKIIRYVESNVVPELIDSYPVIGFSIDYQNIAESMITSLFLKLHNKNVKIMWGGPSITQSTEAFKMLLQREIIDGLVIGEGEATLYEIAKGMNLSTIQGVMSLDDEKSIVYEKRPQLDINILPTPDYTDISLDDYFQMASVYRSRGCTNRCKFCGEWNLFGPRFRVRSVENVIADIDTIIQKHNPGYIGFGESLVNDDLQYFERLCDAMIKKRYKVKFGAHFRANITLELAKKAYQAGFNDAWVGLEAFTDQDLAEMNKGTSVNQNIETIKIFTQENINVLAMLVVGFSNLEEEVKNCENIKKVISKFSQEKLIDSQGKTRPRSIQFRPAPMYLVPGSIDYQQKERSNATWPWKSTSKSAHNRHEIELLEQELSDLPYEFKRPIPDSQVGKLMRVIQEADRNANFSIGGIAQHVIDYVKATRKDARRKRKLERVGVIAQRYQKTQPTI